MSRKRWIVIGGVVILVILIIALLWWWLWPAAEPTVTPPETIPNQVIPAVIPPASQARLAQESSYPLGLRQLAFSFAERYGSYSSDEPTKNLTDLKSQMTVTMWAETQRFIAEREQENVPAFEGVSTAALASTLGEVSATEAEVTVHTQRTRTAGTPPSQSIYYQDLILTFSHVNGQWLVADARWR